MQQKSFREVLTEANRKYQPVQEPKQQVRYLPLEELITPHGKLLADIDYVRRNVQ